MTQYQLHPQLACDTDGVIDLDLCQILLMNDQTYPWLVMVPMRANMRELHDLLPGDQQALMAEVTKVSRAMQRLFKADKMNVAALGNMVEQLHIHVIVRYGGDPAWPGPIWGVVKPKPYEKERIAAMVASLKKALI